VNESVKRVAIVSGAAGGLGAAISKALHAQGSKIAAVDIDEKGLDFLANNFPASDFMQISADVTDPKAVKAAVEKITAAFGAPLIVVNNAGLTDNAATLENQSEELWAKEMAVHATASFLLTRACFAGMRKASWGRVVNISSIAASMGDQAHSAYAASKGAVLGFTKAIALEGARFGITSNAVLPGLIFTPAYEKIRPDVRKRVEARIAMKRSGTSKEVAAMVAFLASENASYTTGQWISVDGGLGLFVF
jgi:3-oxoacyl-[acyl-carrier protein] reductase